MVQDSGIDGHTGEHTPRSHLLQQLFGGDWWNSSNHDSLKSGHLTIQDTFYGLMAS